MNDTIQISIGDRIKALADKNGLTQKALADQAGITDSALCHYIRNQRTPTLENAAKLAMVLGTTLEYLYYGTTIDSLASFESLRRFRCLEDILNHANILNDENLLVLRDEVVRFCNQKRAN